MPTGRRHPLFLRLTKPIDPIYPAAVTAVAWDDEEPIEKAEGVVYLVTRSCTKLRTWAAQLRKLHRADESYKTDEDISSLSAKPIRRESLAEIGKWDCEFWNDGFGRVVTARHAHFVNASVTLMAVILERLDGQPVGFVSFSIRWTIEAEAEDGGLYDLNIEFDQAWIAPEYRYQGWASTAAIGIAFAVKRHVDQIEKTTRWSGDSSVKLRLTVGADVYSSSGERFLESCAQYISFQFDAKRDRIEVADIDVECRL